MATSVLLEREDELLVLRRTIQAAKDDAKGATILVEGSAGVGKTRLLKEAREVAHALGLQVLAAYSSELEQEFAFGIVRQLLEPVVGETDSQQRADWFSGAAETAEAVLGSGFASHPAGGDYAVLHGLYWLVSNVASDSPVALVIDDLQWADPPSLRFLAYLVHRLEDLPIVVIAATRPWLSDDNNRLLDMISTDQATVHLRPYPLSLEATNFLVDGTFTKEGTEADEDFVVACHDATAGNPLLLHQLLQVVQHEGIEPVGKNASKVLDLGPQAISRYVSSRLRELSQSSERLAESIAILGDGVQVAVAAEHANIPLNEALRSVQDLSRVNILAGVAAKQVDPARVRISFVHPLVRAAIYGRLSPHTLMLAHGRAVQVLMASGAETERLGVHVLQTLPSGDSDVVRILRKAADEALHRGSPDIAYSYLRRCLAEPPPSDQRLEVLIQIGRCAQLLNLSGSVEPLREAIELSKDPVQRAIISSQLAGALQFLNQIPEALKVQKVGLLEAHDEDVRRYLAAGMLANLPFDPGHKDLISYADELEQLEFREGFGAGALESMLAMVRSWQGNPVGLDHARRAMLNEQLSTMNGEIFLTLGVWQPLLAGDCEEVFPLLDEAISRSHRTGSVRALAPATDHRGLGRLRQGYLADAEADLNVGKRVIEAANIQIGRPFNGSFRADLYMSQGRLDDAQEALQWSRISGTNDPGAAYFVLLSRARLLRLKKQFNPALATAFQAGRRFSAHSGSNPAMVPWKSEAALCLMALNRLEEARQYAEDEVDDARRWGASRALGRALRVAGLAIGNCENGINLLMESVSVLAKSPARLEYAISMIKVGTALYHQGKVREAQEYLRRGVELADACGAAPLVKNGTFALKETGARPRRINLKGPGSLTPSEIRVAELAAAGAINREIAQSLFVTVKTVEVHLTSVYKKLGISSRAEIAGKLIPTS
ncbi:helix-turn-helix transcriptional regulator [Streptomyces sp. NPDC048508]|uniref:helix-turn-helix transcriptional regulator n=1 Tax=Streptomyces sp. NPDC048508 TaxID=3365561 RepID=UPI0037140184